MPFRRSYSVHLVCKAQASTGRPAQISEHWSSHHLLQSCLTIWDDWRFRIVRLILSSSHRPLVYHPFPLLSGINRSHALSPSPAFRSTCNLERRFFFCLAKLFNFLSVLLALSGMLSKMIKLSALWATLVLVRVTMQIPLPDSGYTGIDCDMAKKIKYTNLVGNVIVTPPHRVSGSSCTSYQGTRNLSAKTYHSILS